MKEDWKSNIDCANVLVPQLSNGKESSEVQSISHSRVIEDDPLSNAAMMSRDLHDDFSHSVDQKQGS